MKTLNIFVALRIFLSLIFLISGIEKVFSPYQNFLYVVQGYQVFPVVLEEAIARIVPWLELFLGLFLLLGLWLKVSLRATALMYIGFISIVGQALVRKLPLEECGCFGQLITLTPSQIILMDLGFLLLTIIVLKNLQKSLVLSIDNAYQ